MEEPLRLREPPCPEPMVSAVMEPGPEMVRVLLGVPIEMSPPFPPASFVCVVLALIVERFPLEFVPAKEMVKSRAEKESFEALVGSGELRKIFPASPVPLAFVVSSEPSLRLSLSVSTKSFPPMLSLEVSVVAMTPLVREIEEPLR